MCKYKIDSIGWETTRDINKGTIITLYALVCAVDKPDFQFLLELDFLEWLSFASKYNEYADNAYYEYINKKIKPRIDNKYFSEIKSIYVNRKQLIFKVFEEKFDLEKEAKKAKALSSRELEKLKKILRKVDPSKSVFRRKGVIFDDIYELIPEGIYKELLMKYPVLHSIDNLKEIVKDRYEDISNGFFERELADLIRGLEKKSEEENGPIPTVSEGSSRDEVR